MPPPTSCPSPHPLFPEVSYLEIPGLRALHITWVKNQACFPQAQAFLPELVCPQLRPEGMMSRF